MPITNVETAIGCSVIITKQGLVTTLMETPTEGVVSAIYVMGMLLTYEM